MASWISAPLGGGWRIGESFGNGKRAEGGAAVAAVLLIALAAFLLFFLNFFLIFWLGLKAMIDLFSRKIANAVFWAVLCAADIWFQAVVIQSWNQAQMEAERHRGLTREECTDAKGGTCHAAIDPKYAVPGTVDYDPKQIARAIVTWDREHGSNDQVKMRMSDASAMPPDFWRDLQSALAVTVYVPLASK